MTATTTHTDTPTFEFFQGSASESRSTPQITVRRGGLLVITHAAAALLGDDVSHVQLAYDPKTRAVGIRAADAEAPGCYLLRTQRKSPSRLVGGKRFFEHHGVAIDNAQTYDAVDFGNGIIGFRFPEASDEAADEATPAPAKRTRRRKLTAA